MGAPPGWGDGALGSLIRKISEQLQLITVLCFTAPGICWVAVCGWAGGALAMVFHYNSAYFNSPVNRLVWGTSLLRNWFGAQIC